MGGSSSKAIDEFFSKQIPSWNVGQVNWRLLVTQRYVCIYEWSDEYDQRCSFDSNRQLADRQDGDAMDVDESSNDEDEDVNSGDDNYDNQERDGDEDDMGMQGLTVTTVATSTTSRSSSTGLSGMSCPPDFIYAYGTRSAVPSPKKIKLLYVPDPSRARSSRDRAMIDLGWVRRHLSADQLAAIRELKGFYYKVPKPTKVERTASGTLILLTEWVSEIPQCPHHT